MPTYRQIAKSIRFLRRQAGLTQDTIAERLGVDPRQYRRYEGGYSRLSIDQLVTLAETFEVSVDDLLKINHNDRFDTYMLVYAIKSLRSPVSRHLVRDMIKIVRSYDEAQMRPSSRDTGTFG